MAVSQNGWKANDRSLIASYKVGGGKIAIRKGDVATVLVYFAKRFHSEVEKLVYPGNWGYAERPIRGSRTTSNHASGTAIDLNAPRHPLGKRGTFSKSQVRKIRKILNDCGGVLRWGGDYRNRKDEMHVEINAGSARVREVARAIRAGKKPGPSGGASAAGGGNTYKKISGKTPLVKLYTKGEPVKRAQLGIGMSKKDADGYWGPTSVARAKKWQKANGLAADGMIGDKSWAKINGGKSKKPAASKGAPFPLPKGHFYYTEDKRNTVHSGYWKSDRPAIRKIQRKVGTGVDGGYGEKTKAAVKRWQKKNGLKADGAVGVNTWKKMFA